MNRQRGLARARKDGMVKVRIDEMTRAEFKQILNKIDVAIVPVASTEQHGPHLPMCQDMASVLYVAEKAAERLHPTVVVTPPPVNAGISYHHMNYPGTLTLSPETFMNAIIEVSESLKRHGVKKVVILNGHGGNRGAISLAGYLIKEKLGLKVAALSYWDLLPKSIVDNVVEEKRLRSSGLGIVPGHAGEFETSLAYVLHPELVREDLMKKWSGTIPEFLEHEILYFEEYRPDGVSRDPTLGTAEKGEIFLNAIIDELVKYIKAFMK